MEQITFTRVPVCPCARNKSHVGYSKYHHTKVRKKESEFALAHTYTLIYTHQILKFRQLFQSECVKE